MSDPYLGYVMPPAAPDRDAAAIQAIRSVAEGGHPDALAVLKRFLREVKHYDFHKPTVSAPRGRPLHANYQAERLDPRHRFGGANRDRLSNATQLVLQFLGEQPYGTAAQFLQWVAGHQPVGMQDVQDLLESWQVAPPPEGQQIGMVRYLDNMARQIYVIEPASDGLLYSRRRKAGAVGAAAALFFDTVPFDTSLSRAAFGGRQRKAIWVQGPSGRFYSSLESQAGVFHHSSFLAGHDVKAAGDWEVEHGQLRTISAMSGHYRPTIEQLHGAVVDLRRTSRRLLEHAKVEVLLLQSSQNVTVPAIEFADAGERDARYLGRYSPGLG